MSGHCTLPRLVSLSAEQPTPKWICEWRKKYPLALMRFMSFVSEIR